MEEMVEKNENEKKRKEMKNGKSEKNGKMTVKEKKCNYGDHNGEKLR